jgi:hypothetical protein
VNILTSSRVIAASRVQMRKASRVSRKRAAQRGCLGGLGALADRSHDRTGQARLGSPSATGRPRRALRPSTLLALRPRLATGVLVSSEYGLSVWPRIKQRPGREPVASQLVSYGPLAR